MSCRGSFSIVFPPNSSQENSIRILPTGAGRRIAESICPQALRLEGRSVFQIMEVHWGCFSGAGFTSSLVSAAADGKADLVTLDDLYATDG